MYKPLAFITDNIDTLSNFEIKKQQLFVQKLQKQIRTKQNNHWQTIHLCLPSHSHHFTVPMFHGAWVRPTKRKHTAPASTWLLGMPWKVWGIMDDSQQT